MAAPHRAALFYVPAARASQQINGCQDPTFSSDPASYARGTGAALSIRRLEGAGDFGRIGLGQVNLLQKPEGGG